MSFLVVLYPQRLVQIEQALSLDSCFIPSFSMAALPMTLDGGLPDESPAFIRTELINGISCRMVWMQHVEINPVGRVHQI